MNPKFSVILPIYNQSKHLPFLVAEYQRHLSGLGTSWELIFVVNGSRDDSHERALELTADVPEMRVVHLDAGGWGGAVRKGLEEASGEWVCYTNSARTLPHQLILTLKYAAASPGHVLKATRVERESWQRKWGSILYNYLNRRLMGTPIWDVNGTPKAIPAACLKGLNLTETGDLIDAEILAKLHRRDIPLVEILIVSPKRIDGKSTTNWRSGVNMIAGLFRLRRNLKTEN
jgi:glycosyltransferase involved in cell wall biosynthesis